MSKCSKQTIKCPHCGEPQEVTIWDSINVTSDPELRKFIFNNEVFTFACKNCNFTSDLLYPCLYHDMEKKLLIQLAVWDKNDNTKNSEYFAKLDEGMKQFTGYTKRIVYSIQSLLEKIYIFNYNLDDRVIEAMKFEPLYQFRKANPEKKVEGLFFRGKDEVYHLRLKCFEGEEFSITFGDTEYEKMRDSISAKLSQFTREGLNFVDQNWALRLLKEVVDEKEKTNL